MRIWSYFERSHHFKKLSLCMYAAFSVLGISRASLPEAALVWPWPFQELIELQHTECQLNKHINGKQNRQREHRSVIGIKPLKVNTCSRSRQPQWDSGTRKGEGECVCACAVGSRQRGEKKRKQGRRVSNKWGRPASECVVNLAMF